MNILILMAGSDKDFCEKGYPKYLIEIKNKPIIQRRIVTEFEMVILKIFV